MNILKEEKFRTGADAKSQNAFDEQGFPEDLCQAFQRATNPDLFQMLTKEVPVDPTNQEPNRQEAQGGLSQKGYVIMSRVPGANCNTLIAEAYDQKGFHIKAKSCDWGPMAGFLCQLPPFSKNGTGGMKSNADANNKYYNTYNSLQTAESLTDKGERDAVNKSGSSGYLPGKYSPFVHIAISDARKKEIVTNLGPNNKFGITKYDANANIGTAQSKDKSVTIDFYMKNIGTVSKPIWQLYHRNITVKQETKEYLDLNNNYMGYVPWSSSNKKQLIEFFAIKFKFYGIKENGVTFNNENYYPILGIMNPFPPYKMDIGDTYRDTYRPSTDIFNPVQYASDYLQYKYYKNAVTGDYDLFSVWPDFDKKSGTLRKSETAVIGDTNGKAFYLKINDVIIEVIPNFSELKPKGDYPEDPLTGNYSGNVALVAQTLNSFVESLRQGVSKKSISFPNVAFHSDEGGRPGMMEIDFPFAVFAPTRKQDTYCRAIIGNKLQFLELILECKKTHQILLHIGWFYDFLRKPNTENEKGLGYQEDFYNIAFKQVFGFQRSEIGTTGWEQIGRYLGDQNPDTKKSKPGIKLEKMVNDIRTSLEGVKVFSPVWIEKSAKNQNVQQNS